MVAAPRCYQRYNHISWEISLSTGTGGNFVRSFFCLELLLQVLLLPVGLQTLVFHTAFIFHFLRNFFWNETPIQSITETAGKLTATRQPVKQTSCALLSLALAASASGWTAPSICRYSMLQFCPGVGVDGKKCKFANIEGNFEKSVWKSDPADLARLGGQVAKLGGGSQRAAVTKWNFWKCFKMAKFEVHTWLNPIPLSFLM